VPTSDPNTRAVWLARAPELEESPRRTRSNTAQLNQTLLERDQEIASLQHKLSLAEEELEKAEEKVKELKGAAEEGDNHRTTGENLARKVQLLEEELDKAEKDLKETTEKLRQVDVKAEHFERAIQRVEQERDDWEKKYGVSTCLRAVFRAVRTAVRTAWHSCVPLLVDRAHRQRRQECEFFRDTLLATVRTVEAGLVQ